MAGSSNTERKGRLVRDLNNPTRRWYRLSIPPPVPGSPTPIDISSDSEPDSPYYTPATPPPYTGMDYEVPSSPEVGEVFFPTHPTELPMWKPVPPKTDVASTSRPVLCNFCAQPGHTEDYCPCPKDRECYKCNTGGHARSNCPFSKGNGIYGCHVCCQYDHKMRDCPYADNKDMSSSSGE